MKPPTRWGNPEKNTPLPGLDAPHQLYARRIRKVGEHTSLRQGVCENFVEKLGVGKVV